MKALKRISNISKYGLGAGARERKRADKELRRHERFFDSDLWEHDEAGARRKYASYDEYVAHQASKLDKIAPRLRDKEAEDFAALLLYRLGRSPSDRSSIVQVRLGEAFG